MQCELLTRKSFPMRKVVARIMTVAMWMSAGVLAAAAEPSVADDTNAPIRGLTGSVTAQHIAVPAAESIPPLSSSRPPEEVDLKRMAEWAMNYLIESPRKELNYEPVFQLYPYRCPPIPTGSDPVVACDTDARMDWEWYYMRDITGSKKGLDVENAFHKRMRDYVDKDGIVWSHPGAYNEGNTSAKYEKKDYVIHMWGATKILKSQCEDYARTRNPESKELARKIMLALKQLVKWDDQGRCYSPCGNGALDVNRNVIPNGWNPHPLPIVDPLLSYYEVFNDPDALAFAKAYADGMIAGIQPDGVRFGADGSFLAHSHVTMHSVWGVARLGMVTGDSKYTDFAKRVFDFFLTKGTGVAWFPAAQGYAGEEMCCLSDVMSNAAYIARGGHPEYFDYIERYMRNRVGNTQFIITPDFEAKYAKYNAAAGAEKIAEGLETLKKFQGGFAAAVGLNAWDNHLLGNVVYADAPEFCMIGCCQPEGMRAVYTTWLHTIARWPKSPLGAAGVYVNMSFNRESEWGKVTSFMPEAGRLTVVAAVKDTFFLRPPHWVSHRDVHAFVDSVAVPVQWSGDYVQFEAKPGDEMTITYPLVAFVHRVEGLREFPAGLSVTYQWLGNMVMGVDPPPPSTSTPVFLGKPRVLPPAP